MCSGIFKHFVLEENGKLVEEGVGYHSFHHNSSNRYISYRMNLMGSRCTSWVLGRSKCLALGLSAITRSLIFGIGVGPVLDFVMGLRSLV